MSKLDVLPLPSVSAPLPLAIFSVPTLPTPPGASEPPELVPTAMPAAALMVPVPERVLVTERALNAVLPTTVPPLLVRVVVVSA
jgi:hypothetical protein